LCPRGVVHDLIPRGHEKPAHPTCLLAELAGMSDLMRRLHYSIHTERAYCDWVSRFVRFHQLPSHVEGWAALQPN